MITRFGSGPMRARTFSMNANSAPSSAASRRSRQSLPAYCSNVSYTCRPRFHIQRASSSAHETRNSIASVAGNAAAVRLRHAHASHNAAASATAIASSAGKGNSCTSAPPTTVLIDVPLQRSNASHSRVRSDITSTIPIGLAVTPRILTGVANGPRIDSASPVMRPTQFGSSASTTGNRRPD
jgi:hypothetical protein